MKVLHVWAGTPLLWQLAHCQNVSSAPLAENFVARREPAITILNDHLYITGGRFSQLVDGEIAKFGGSDAWPLNDTLSISLKESWVNSTVEIKVTEQEAPSFNKPAFWRDPEQQTAYLWGGWAGNGTLPRRRPELWQFTANDDGGGEWSRPEPANADKLVEITRTYAASAATCKGKALYLGGYQTRLTDPRVETGGNVPAPGLVTYDMGTRRWDNVSAAPGLDRLGFNELGTSIHGAAACAESFGPRGVFFPIGGHVWVNALGEGQTFMDTANLTFYDVGNDKWHAQQTSGDAPPLRDRHCVAGAQGRNGTYEIYVYGGNDHRYGIMSDLYVLSLPGFVWFRANTTSEPRSSHACIVANNRQMLVVGGTRTNNIDEHFTLPDVWSQGLGVLDLSSLSWKHQYDADAGPYEPPQAVADWYANGNLDSVEWNDDDVKALFITSDSDDASSSNGPIIGGVVGGILGVGLAVGAAWYFVRRRRRQRAAATMAIPPLRSSDRDTAGYDPAVSQNYQHYAIELNNSSVPYHKQQAALGHGPYEMAVEHKPHENGPLELGAETGPQELPARL